MKTKRTFLAICTVLLLAVASGITVYAVNVALSVAFSEPTITCNGDGTATVTFNYTIATGDSSAATVTGSIDGATPFALPGVASGDWTCGSPCNTKTAEGSYQTTLPNGEHTFTVCATQPGSGGNPDKTGCATQTVTINCAVAGLCSNTDVFGEVPANKNLCKANGNIEVQFRGDFDTVATLEIKGPDTSNFDEVVSVDRAGDSCNYHYNWNPAPPGSGTDSIGNGGPGLYTFTVTGNGHTLVFYANLECQLPPGRH